MPASRRHVSFPVVLALAAVLAVVVSSGIRAEEDGDGTPVCLEPTNFIANGDFELESNPAEESLEVVDLRSALYEGCERFVIELDAATSGEVEAEFIRGLGIVRVHLLDADEVHEDATDLDTGGELAGQAFVVRADDNSLHVDLHVAGEAEAAVTLLEDPARVVVDLRPGGGAIPAPAAINDITVLLDPRDGSHAAYPLDVSGYVRHLEANVVIRFERHGEEVGEETIVTANDWIEAWGAFEAVIEDGPAGAVVLHVGEYSVADGSWQGVAVELDIGGRSLVPMIARDVDHE